MNEEIKSLLWVCIIKLLDESSEENDDDGDDDREEGSGHLYPETFREWNKKGDKELHSPNNSKKN